jgi:hypothetical protein
MAKETWPLSTMSDEDHAVEIWTAKCALDHKRRKLFSEAVNIIDKQLAEETNAIQKRCEEITNHKFVHNGYNITREVEFLRCQYCGLHKSKDLNDD